MIRVPRRVVVGIVGAVVVLAVAVVLIRSDVVADTLTPRAVASHDEVLQQQAAAERAIQRAFAAAVDQMHKARALKLPISDAQAAAIEQRNTDDLKALRHSALVSIAQVFAVTGADAETYATATERRLDAAPVPDRNATAPVLLAPRLFTIVQRMDELAAQISDRGTREMTQPVGGPSPSPSTSPSRTP